MATFHKDLSYQTERKSQFIDITPDVEMFVKESGIQTGIVNVQTKHTTCAVIVQEKESGLLKDIAEMFARITSGGVSYQHDNFEIRTENLCEGECANGQSHCLALLLSVNVALNIVDSEIVLGRWQRIMLLELDRARHRQVNVMVMGE